MKASAIRFAFAAATVMCLAGTDAVAGNNQYDLGVEGFYDNYQEPVATVNSKATYGSVTGNFTHNWNAFFAALDGRASYGFDDYQSESGTADRIPQWEFEGRIRGGVTLKGGFSPYIGLGTRYYWDELKGVVTNLGALGYDRRITQIYIPIGFSFDSKISDDLHITPNLEYDQLVWGQVSSRLGTIPGGENLINHQHDGWGVRGDVMLGWGNNGSYAFQAGPFIRYWNIGDSNITAEGYEPHNTRLQAGLQARVVW